MKKIIRIDFGDEGALAGTDVIEVDVCDACGQLAFYRLHDDNETAFCEKCARNKFLNEFASFNDLTMANVLGYEVL
ncbi:MAG: hypothetical protein IJ740_08420 [Ruminococcus sp.]|nr:hypothetical protein [Ruminococcus sp.]